MPFDVEFLENCNSISADTIVSYFNEKIIPFPPVLKAVALAANFSFSVHGRHIRYEKGC